MLNLMECVFSSWSPGIGDPSLLGWVTVGLYFIAALMCFRYLITASFGYGCKREQLFWLLTGLLLAALAVNKQLDLQSALTAAGRCIAKAQGWYENRREVQRDLIMMLIIFCIFGFAVMLWWLRGLWRNTGIAALGLAFVASFVLVRAVSFHHFDALLKMHLAGMRMNGLLEWSGPLLIILATLVNSRRKRPDAIYPGEGIAYRA